jgi:hypothetical protein
MGAKLFDLPGSFDINKIQMIDMVLIKKLSNIKMI